MAIHANSTPAPLSHLFTDPLVRRAFERVERDDGLAAVIAARPGPRLSGGAAAGLLRGSRLSDRPVFLRPDQFRGKLPQNPGHPAENGVVDAGSRRDPALLRGADRQAIATAIDRLIAILDTLDATSEDLEGDPSDYEDGGDDELTLGAPENHPFRWCLDMDDNYNKSRGRRRLGDQTTWAAGSGDECEVCREGESEAGYDLPEGDDERCASDVIDEPSLGAPENHNRFPNQEHWPQGGHVWRLDVEDDLVREVAHG